MKRLVTMNPLNISKLQANHTTAALMLCGLLASSHAFAGKKLGADDFGVMLDKPGSYSLKADLVAAPGQLGPAILITADNVHVNLGGHTIIGGVVVDDHGHGIVGNAGIQVLGANKVHINNGTITGFSYGIDMADVHDSHLNSLAITHNYRGIWLRDGSTGNLLNNNEPSDHVCCGIRVDHSNANRVLANVSDRNNEGFHVSGDGNEVQGNAAAESRLFGIWLVHGDSNAIESNDFVNTDGASKFIRVGIALGRPAVFGGSLFATNTSIRNNVSLGNSPAAPGLFQWDVFENNLYDKSVCENALSNNLFVQDNESGADAGPDSGCIQ